LPSDLLDYLVSLAVENKAMAYLLVGRDGRVIDGGGNLAHYGLGDGWTGQSVAEQLVCLEGMLPLDSKGTVLSSVSLMPGLYTELHLFPAEEGDWVLLFDVTAESQQLQSLQQKANEACLLRDRLARCEQALEAARTQISMAHETSKAERQPTE
jgi:hypothetical protein